MLPVGKNAVMEYARLFVSAVLTAFLDLLRPFSRWKPPKLLVIKLDHLGDVINALPVFPALREALPDARIDVLAGPWARDILEGQPGIDRVLTYESKRFSRSPGSNPGFFRRLRQIRSVGAHRYTHIIELRGDAWTLLLPFLSGATRRVDRGTVRFEAWLERRMGGAAARDRPQKHELETNLEIIRPVVEDLVLPPKKVDIKIRHEERASLLKRTRADHLPDGVPFVTLHVGASWRPRAWRPERFAETALQLLEGYPGLHVCFVGSDEDKDIADKIGIIVRHPHAHFFFDLKIFETAALLERSAFFIGSDSGIAHLAAAVGTPSVVLFGPQDPERFRPWSDRTIVLHRPVPCFPCKQTKCVVPSNPCVNLVFVDDVMRVAQTILGDRLEPPRPVPLRPPGPVPGPAPGPIPGL